MSNDIIQICPYNEGSVVHTREFVYDKETDNIIKQTETVQHILMECLGDRCPFYDEYDYRGNSRCRRVANDVGEDL